MTLVLQIENYSVLDDGGPVQFTVPDHGAQIGRSKSMDWTLPDPTRHISSHHFDIVVQHGVFYMQDVSTNGTFLQGSRYRLEGLHQINNGDRFQVGSYFIVASLAAPENTGLQLPTGFTAPPQQPQAPGGWNEKSDIWDVGGPADPIEPSPPEPVARADDFANDFLDPPSPPAGGNQLQSPPNMPGGAIATPAHLKTPTLAPSPSSSAIKAPPHTSPPASDSGATIIPQELSVPPIHPTAQVPIPDPAPIQPEAAVPSVPRPDMAKVERTQFPMAQPTPVPPAAEPRSAAPTPASAGAPIPDVAATPTPAPPAMAPATPPAAHQADFVRAFIEGAGLNPDDYEGIDPTELATALGQSTRVIAAELMMLLQARASTKQFTRGGARTMRRNTDNNPLKFLPDAKQAIETMYLKHRAGFLQGPEGLGEALKDIRLHQTAVFAAIQPALAALLQGLSPDEIDEGGAGALMIGSGKRGKAWDTFVERWDGKTAQHENGMLDEFLTHFAQAYGDMVDEDDM